MKAMIMGGKRRIAPAFALALAFVLAFSTAATATSSKPIYDPNKPELLYDKNLYAESAILMEQHSGRVLYDMKGSQKMQPASITKIMTLLLALENASLDDMVTVGREITQIPGDSSRLGLIQGETLSLESLLHGMMIKSGNDASMTVAAHVGGSVENFVAMMNARAKELGCQNTKFANPHGYEDKNHYTTAWDMALIARAGMDNAAFREIVNTSKHTIPANNKRSQSMTISSTNPFISSNSKLAYHYADGTGIKTGYFSAAKHTVVSSASRDGVDLIAVVLKTTKEGKWIDSTRLMEYGFTVCQYDYTLGGLYNSAPVTLPVTDSSGALTGEALALTLASTDMARSYSDTAENYNSMYRQFSGYYVYNGPTTVSGPVYAGTKIGTLDFYPQEGNLPLTFDLLAAHDVIVTLAVSPTGNPYLIPSY